MGALPWPQRCPLLLVTTEPQRHAGVAHGAWDAAGPKLPREKAQWSGQARWSEGGIENRGTVKQGCSNEKMPQMAPEMRTFMMDTAHMMNAACHSLE